VPLVLEGYPVAVDSNVVIPRLLAFSFLILSYLMTYTNCFVFQMTRARDERALVFASCCAPWGYPRRPCPCGLAAIRVAMDAVVAGVVGVVEVILD